MNPPPPQQQYYAQQAAPTPGWVKGLAVGAVLALIYFVFIYEPAPPLVVVPPGGVTPPPVSGTGTPGAGSGQTSGTGSDVGSGQTGGAGDPTSGQTGGAGSATDGQTGGGDGTGDDPNMNTGGGGTTTPTTPVDPLAGIKFIKLYSGKNYEGTSKTLLPGMTVTLGPRTGPFAWNSMKVTPQVKLVWSRYTGGGRTSRGFAYGLFNVADMREYMLSIPAIGGNYQLDTGVALERSYGGGDNGSNNIIKLKVSTNDAEWMADMNKTYQGCVSTTKAWGGPPKYPISYCDKSKPDALKMAGTIS